MAVFSYRYIPDIFAGDYKVIGQARKVVVTKVDRPKAPIKLMNIGKKTEVIWCLLDSGADNIVMGAELADYLNIDLSKIPVQFTTAVGGNKVKIKRYITSVLFENRSFLLPIDFCLEQTFPILGRDFFELFESITFKQKEKKVELVINTNSN